MRAKTSEMEWKAAEIGQVKFVNWLGRWEKIVVLVKEHESLCGRPLANFDRMRQIETKIGYLIVTALGKHGNEQCAVPLEGP